jgi:hypothetical protein
MQPQPYSTPILALKIWVRIGLELGCIMSDPNLNPTPAHLLVYIERISVHLKLDSTLSLVNEDTQVIQKSGKKSPFLTVRSSRLL